MKQGIFDIDKGTPIVVAYELPKPNPQSDFYSDFATPELSSPFVKEMKEYESSRQEWEVENTVKDDITGEVYVCNPGGYSDYLGTIVFHKQVQFIEIQPPESSKRGKCKIVKIL